MPLITSKANGGSFGYGWSSPAVSEELGGMVLVAPTSIDYSGTSASIGTNGSVEFTAVTSLTLNGVFSADYENYVLDVAMLSSSNYVAQMQLVDSGGVADGTDYSTALATVSGSILGASATQTNTTGFLILPDTTWSWSKVDVYSPYLERATAFRSVSVNGKNTVNIYDYACHHALYNSYDGIKVTPAVGEATGSISVYGLVGA